MWGRVLEKRKLQKERSPKICPKVPSNLWLNTELLMCELKLYESGKRTDRMQRLAEQFLVFPEG